MAGERTAKLEAELQQAASASERLEAEVRRLEGEKRAAEAAHAAQQREHARAVARLQAVPEALRLATQRISDTLLHPIEETLRALTEQPHPGEAATGARASST